MDFSAVLMLIFAVVVIFGGLYLTINKAVNSSKVEKEE